MSLNLIFGRHFAGSSILYWDRSKEPNQAEQKSSTRQDGIIFCADTAMVQPTQKGFTFQYSVPNMVRLRNKGLEEVPAN